MTKLVTSQLKFSSRNAQFKPIVTTGHCNHSNNALAIQFQKGCMSGLDVCMQAMRSLVNKRSTVHLVDKTVLLNAFAAVLKKRECSVKDTVRTEQFQELWRRLGVTLDREQAEAFFNKYGQVRICMHVCILVYTGSHMSTLQDWKHFLPCHLTHARAHLGHVELVRSFEE